MRGGRVAALGVALVAFTAPAAWGRTLAEIVGPGFTRPISDALALSVGRALPVISASAGVVFSFDPSGAYVRERSIAGQLFLERAEPVGRARWNLSLNYQRVKFDSFEGKDIEQLKDTVPVVDPDTGGAVTFPRFGIDLETHEVTTSATYGLTDDLDINLALPVLLSELRVQLSQGGANPADVKRFTESATKLGVGDIFLRGKYRFLNIGRGQAALGLVFRLPSGEQENLQGTGAFEIAPLLYASGKAVEITRAVALQPYFNAGVNFDTEDVGSSEARWGVGLDAAIVGRITLAVAVLGRHPFRRLAPAGFFTLKRQDGSERPLFGINGDRPDLYDVSLGTRVNLWRDTVIGFANAILPLNDDGVRSNVIPTIGVEIAF